MSAWCTRPVASSGLTGTRSGPAALSLNTTKLAPASTAASTCAAMRASASRSPAGPSATGKVVSTTVVDQPLKPRSALIAATSLLEMTGCGRSSRPTCLGSASVTSASGPMNVRSDVTTASRNGSIAGLVTCRGDTSAEGTQVGGMTGGWGVPSHACLHTLLLRVLVGVFKRLIEALPANAHSAFPRSGSGTLPLFLPTPARAHLHLRKQLLEVLERLLGALAEHRERGVVAHGAERLGARLGHRRQDVLQGFKRVPKQLQLLNQRVQRRARRRTGLGVKREDVVRGRVGRSSRQRRSRCLRRRRLDNVGH
eukprot:362112-Chlamydomonas_euryale.AAC.2